MPKTPFDSAQGDIDYSLAHKEKPPKVGFADLEARLSGKDGPWKENPEGLPSTLH
jgi:hypothetical protein